MASNPAPRNALRALVAPGVGLAVVAALACSSFATVLWLLPPNAMASVKGSSPAASSSP